VTAANSTSIHARLLNLARTRGEDFNLVLTRYARERFLYRLSLVPARNFYWLKGSMLFDLWFDEPHRPTRDADFLGLDEVSAESLASTFREICEVVVDDGMEFDPNSISIEEIRDNNRYGGRRVKLLGNLGNTRCHVHLDVGYGDAVTPGPEEATFPTLLEDLLPPRLIVYPRATVVAEKLETIVSLGMANSRMKDFFDLRALASENATDAELLGEAIAATFKRRRTIIPTGVPLGLSDEFAHDPTKQAQWTAFLRKNRLKTTPLAEVVVDVRNFLAEPLQLARLKN